MFVEDVLRRLLMLSPSLVEDVKLTGSFIARANPFEAAKQQTGR